MRTFTLGLAASLLLAAFSASGSEPCQPATPEQWAQIRAIIQQQADGTISDEDAAAQIAAIEAEVGCIGGPIPDPEGGEE